MTLFFVITGVNGVYGGKLSNVEVARFLCDGFFVAGVVLLGFAALYWASDKGAFDGLKYSFTSFSGCTFRRTAMTGKKRKVFRNIKKGYIPTRRKRKTYR